MTDQPARVTPREISDLLDQATRLTREGGSLDEQIAYHERKASLLTRIAAELDTAEAHVMALNDLGRSCSLIFPTWWRWSA